MIEFHLFKQLKKRIRRKRRPLWVLGSFVLVAFLTASSFAAGGEKAFAYSEQPIMFEAEDSKDALLKEELTYIPSEEGSNDTELQSFMQLLEEMEEPITVERRIIYVCGEEIYPLGKMTPDQLSALLQSHPDWSARLNQESKAVMLLQRVEDLSEHCKRNAYMGIDRNGFFSLFDGEPSKERVLRTFFQIDVRYMESSLPKHKLDELAQGIRISDIDEYNSVLSTYSDYAMETDGNVLRSMSQSEQESK